MNLSNLKHIPKEERPYEKCLKAGPESLSDAELLAILLRTGVAGKNVIELAMHILYEIGPNGLLNLQKLSFEELLEIRGIGNVKAVQLICLAELTKRMTKCTNQKNIHFESPEQIAMHYMEELRHNDQEVMCLLMLNTKCELIKKCDISKGTVNMTVISPREIFIEALKSKAVYIVLLHNHPSGDPTPSSEDITFTSRMQETGEILGVQLIDHIIIGNNCYFSFSNEQMLQKG